MKKNTITALIGASALWCIGSAYAEPAKDNRQIRIIDGKETTKGAYPFMTALIQKGMDPVQGQMCGASLVDKRYVLTASHCVEGMTSDQLDVWVSNGEVSLEQPDNGKTVEVSQIYMHLDYDSQSLDNDIAILELAEEVTNVTPVKLMTPDQESTLKTGDLLTVMGWGNRDADPEGRDFPVNLHEVEVGLYDREACNTAYQGGITEQMICFGFPEGGKDSCQGDSGGPLIAKIEDEWYQAGVVSFGDVCAAPNSPGVYARVSKFLDWVKAQESGISYNQNSYMGHVEHSYDEVVPVVIKNIAADSVSFTGVELEKTNMDQASISNNGCDGKTLATNDECTIEVKTAFSKAEQAGFSLTVNTNHDDKGEFIVQRSFDVLDDAKASYNKHLMDGDHDISWFESPEAGWEIQSDKVSQGSDAIASSAIADSQSSVVMATFDRGRITKFEIDYAVSSEEQYDGLIIVANGEQLGFYTGESDYKAQEIPLIDGKNRVTFVYYKDYEQSGGEDKAYLDNLKIEVSNTAPVAKVKDKTIKVDAGKSVSLDASGSTDPENDALTYKWTVESGDNVTISDDTKAVASLTAPEDMEGKTIVVKVQVTDAYGATATETVNVEVNEESKGLSSSWGMLLAVMTLLFRRFKYNQ